jgi:hypothetical protein
LRNQIRRIRWQIGQFVGQVPCLQHLKRDIGDVIIGDVKVKNEWWNI